MNTHRSSELILVGYYLSKFGIEDPPERLNTNKWEVAYQKFYNSLSDGRDSNSFHNTLKRTRDNFDSHHSDTKRIGNIKKGIAGPLGEKPTEIFKKYSNYSEEGIWEEIKKFCD